MIWNTIQCHISNTIQNWNIQQQHNSRTYPVRYEDWGGDSNSNNANNDNDTNNEEDVVTNDTNTSSSNYDIIGTGTTTSILQQQHPPNNNNYNCTIRLYQYRPAWLEQLLLRIYHIPHIVINTSYAVTEVTGPLPYLMDLECNNNYNNNMKSSISLSSSSSCSKNQTMKYNNHPKGSSYPVMVGRHQQYQYDIRSTDNTNSISNLHNNGIVQYLQLYRNIDLDAHFHSNKQQQHQSTLYITMITEILNPYLLLLRYHVDVESWKSIYRLQCITASKGTNIYNNNNNTNNSFWKYIYHNIPTGFASYQAWSERIHTISKFNTSQLQLSKEDVIDKIRSIYTIFEHTFNIDTVSSSSSSSSNEQRQQKQYIFNTDQPTLVDCLLWDHLMNALTDIHLIMVLTDYPQLLQFIQHIWDQYSFGTTVVDVMDQSSSSTSASSSSIALWNLEENALNAFTDIPLLSSSSSKHRVDDNDNMNMLDKISSIQNNLRKSLALAKLRRNSTISTSITHIPTNATTKWHSWSMNTNTTKTMSPEEQVRQQYKYNDDVWIMSVVATTFVAMVGFVFAS